MTFCKQRAQLSAALAVPSGKRTEKKEGVKETRGDARPTTCWGTTQFAVWPNRLSLPLVGVLVIACVALLQHRFGATIVVGDSMLPTYRTGDFLWIDKKAYESADPARGDIVVARHRGDTIVKRVVGLPGEELEIQSGDLFVNGEFFSEDHRSHRPQGMLSIGRGTLLASKFALLGDNRDLPPSQVVHAVLPKTAILGKVMWSISWARRVPPPSGIARASR